MREDWHGYFKTIARAVSTRSTCPRKQVGAVIVVNKRILASGYNGSPAGEPHCTDAGCNVVSNHCTRAIHAERNAVNQVIELADLFGNSSILHDLDFNIYCTLEPCRECKKYIAMHFHRPVLHWIEDYEDYERGKLQS